MKPLIWLIPIVLISSCGDTGRDFVSLALQARGIEDTPFVVDGWEVALTQADIGFGPLTFCATESANTEFCEVGLLEFRAGTTIDGLDPNVQVLGELFGTTGTVRSGFFDYGVSWLLTKAFPQANEGAPGAPAIVRFDQSDYEPAGHSLRLSGTASCIAGAATCCPGALSCPASFDFEAKIDVHDVQAGTSAVHGARTEQEITSSGGVLTLDFDTSAWTARLDLSDLAALAEAGADPVLITPDESAYSALVIAMTNQHIPTFTWE